MAGAPKKIESPEKLWEYFESYREEVKSNPIIGVEQKRGNTALPRDISNIEEGVLNKMLNPIIELPIQRPLTMEGFENWLEDCYGIGQVQQYLENRGGAYEDFISIVSRVRREIRIDQIEGGMAGVYAQNLSARITGLSDKVESKVVQNVQLLNIDPLTAEDKKTK